MHRTVAAAIPQAGAFAPHRFRNQKVGGPRQHQGGGVKLHKFQVLQCSARLPGHRHPIATGLGRIGGVGKQVAAPAGGQHHGSRPQPADLTVGQQLQPPAAPRLDPQLQHNYPVALHQAWSAPHLPFQGIDQGTARAVLGVEHAPMAVGGFQGGAQLRPIPVEGHAQLQQARHTAGGPMHEQLHRLPLAEPCTGVEGVVNVAAKAVVGTGHRGDAALGPAAG